jgi:hypothetical protein
MIGSALVETEPATGTGCDWQISIQAKGDFGIWFGSKESTATNGARMMTA